jgi:hypothetical protein
MAEESRFYKYTTVVGAITMAGHHHVSSSDRFYSQVLTHFAFAM